MTRQGADRLRQQIAELLEKRHILISGSGQEVKNADLRRIDSQIQKLQQVLGSVIVVEPPTDADTVAFGALVHVRDTDGEEDNYKIVGVHEAEPAEGRISASSPLARALMNGRAGDKVRFQTPAGERELTVLRVSY